MRFVVVVVTAVLAGCATLPPKADDPAHAWAQRQLVLASIEGWDLSGRVGVQAGTDGGAASIRWVRVHTAHRIDLLFPFGNGSMQLTQDANGAELRDRDQRRYRDASIRDLLRQATGWDFPLDGFSYWVLGLPAPGELTASALDDYGRLRTLTQHGWSIEFSDYLGCDDVDLPTRVVARRGVAAEAIDVRLGIVKCRLTRALAAP